MNVFCRVSEPRNGSVGVNEGLARAYRAFEGVFSTAQACRCYGDDLRPALGTGHAGANANARFRAVLCSLNAKNYDDRHIKYLVQLSSALTGGCVWLTLAASVCHHCPKLTGVAFLFNRPNCVKNRPTPKAFPCSYWRFLPPFLSSSCLFSSLSKSVFS